MRDRLLLLVLVVLVPLLVVQAGIYVAWYHHRWAEEEQANLEEAWAVATTFEAYVRDVRRQELAIGAALVGPYPYTTEQANKFLAAATREYSSIHACNWANPEGKVIASSQSKALGSDIADQAYFREVRGGRPSAISNILVDKIGSTPSFIIARRIDDKKGKLSGVVCATVEAGGFRERLIESHRGEEGTVTIFDHEGVLLCSTDEQETSGQDWRNNDRLLAGVLDTLKGAAQEAR